MVIALGGIVLHLQTANGTVQIELSDPDAKVEVTVDGDTIDIAGLAKPLRVKANKDHQLHVIGEDFETHGESFTVKRGQNLVLFVTLRPKSEEAVPKSEWALLFDGLTSTVVTPLRHDGKTPITIEAFVTPRAQRDLGDIISNTKEAGTALRIGRDGKWHLISHFNGPFILARSDEQVSVGKRVHVAGVFDGECMRLFVDGRLQRQSPETAKLYPSDYSFAIGSAGARHACWFTGIIHAVRISNATRYREDFLPLYPFSSDDTVELLYSFTEGEGRVAYDSSGHENHGVIQGAAWVKPSRGIRRPDF